MKNKSKESKYPCINWTFGRDGDYYYKRFWRRPCTLHGIGWEFYHTCNLSFLCIHMWSRKKKWKADSTGYIYIYIYIFLQRILWSEHTNKYKNNKWLHFTVEMALDSSTPIHLNMLHSETLSPGQFNRWLPYVVIFEQHTCWGIWNISWWFTIYFRLWFVPNCCCGSSEELENQIHVSASFSLL